jgi:hypothetical protein
MATPMLKKVLAAAGAATTVITLVLVWRQAEFPTLAWAEDVERLERGFTGVIERLEKRIDGNERTLLYRERDRVEDKIDELQQRYEADPGNRALRELIRLREQEREEIDRQLDELAQ